MAKKPTISTVATGYQATDTINDNFQNIRNQFENTLSRDGSTPNAMEADLDLNSNDLLNVNTVYTTNLFINGSPFSSNGGPLIDGDKGDITVSSTGTVWNINAGVISTTELGGNITTAGKALLDDASASAQRTTLGLGTIATQASNNVSITGGSVTGITDLAIADGGTGQSTATAAANALDGYLSITASAGTTTLTSTSPRIIVIGGSTTHTIQLPDATTLENGWIYYITNHSSGSITVQTSNATAFGFTINSGMSVRIVLRDKTNGTALAGWSYSFTGATSRTGTGGAIVYATSPTLTTPNLGTPSAVTLTNATGLPLSTGITGTLSVTNGGTGVNGSTAANGQLLIGNGTGYSLANLTAGSNVTITNSSGGITIAATSGSGGLTDGDYGDITVSGSNTVWTIDPQAVTYSKIQNVSATDKILGRSSSGAGIIEEIACTAAGRTLLSSANAAAQLAALGITNAKVNLVIITSVQIYTPSANTKSILVYLTGAGGAGGSTRTTSIVGPFGGSGGSGAGTVIFSMDATPSQSFQITVGAATTTTSTTSTIGANGSSSTFALSDGTIIVSAPGGLGGTSASTTVQGSAGVTNTTSFTTPNSSYVAAGKYLQIPGGKGAPAMAAYAGAIASNGGANTGIGGGSFWGTGAEPAYIYGGSASANTSIAGPNAVIFGTGGGGAVKMQKGTSSVSAVGGSGAAGICMILEIKS